METETECWDAEAPLKEFKSTKETIAYLRQRCKEQKSHMLTNTERRYIIKYNQEKQHDAAEVRDNIRGWAASFIVVCIIMLMFTDNEDTKFAGAVLITLCMMIIGIYSALVPNPFDTSADFKMRRLFDKSIAWNDSNLRMYSRWYIIKYPFTSVLGFIVGSAIQWGLIYVIILLWDSLKRVVGHIF